MQNRTVALVGRPNVGKSRIFNRLANKRVAIVHDQPGVTRDVNALEIPEGKYTLLDTGGIGLTEQRWDRTQTPELIAAAEEQVFVAISAAKLIFFVVDGMEGLTTLDEIIADRLRKSGQQVQLVVNKIDQDVHDGNVNQFKKLGFGQPMAISAEHNRGFGALKNFIQEKLGPPPVVEVDESGKPQERRVKLAFIGRPNVGKSSLCNRLLNDERLVVSEVPGTTRDSIEHDLDYTNDKGQVWPFRLMDTAGLRKKKKFDSPVEYFSSLRSTNALETADVVFLVLDAMDGVTLMDKTLAGLAVELGKPLAVIVNKWDFALEQFAKEPIKGYESEREFRESFEKSLRDALYQLPGSTVLFTSALTGYALDRVLRSARKLDQIAGTKMSTPKINQLLNEMMQKREPRSNKGKRFKVYYAVQTGIRPIRIRIFCNQSHRLEDPYKRYLSRGFIDRFGIEGCPIIFDLVGKPARKQAR